MRPAGAPPAQTVGEALAAAVNELERAGIAAARNDAEILLAHSLGTDGGGLLVRRSQQLPDEIASRVARFIARRVRREPLQHLIGEQEFHGLAFRVDPRALVPRPETEGVVDAALQLIGSPDERIADLGTGTGCIAVTLAVKSGCEILALDSSGEALELARENAARHRVDDKVRFTRGDMLLPPAGWRGRMDIIVSNPPYVSEDEWTELEPEVRDHDPRQALVAGPTGYEMYDGLVPVAFDLLRPAGHMILELGCGQLDHVRGLASRAGFEDVDVRPDLRGIPRVLVARRPG